MPFDHNNQCLGSVNIVVAACKLSCLHAHTNLGQHTLTFPRHVILPVLAVHTALSSSNTQPSVREAALYLGIDQHMQAQELLSPPRMPQCLSSSKVSKALAAAINTKYAGQLQMNASVDTTYIQVRPG